MPEPLSLASALHLCYPWSPPVSSPDEVPATIDCPVCGSHAPVHPFGDNERETGHCTVCLAWNRVRALAVVLLRALSDIAGRELRSLADPGLPGDVRIYGAEKAGPIHERLCALPGYEFGEFLGPGHRSGDVVDGLQHQDLMGTSFADATFDVVLTSDVFEHIPEPYVAHREVYRILKPGGRHLFTVPAVMNWPMDWQRAYAGPDGIEHYAEPEYHGTELDQNLVYNVVGLESLVELRGVGFDPRVWYVDEPRLGIVGPNTFVYEARKAFQPSDRPVPTGRRPVAGAPLPAGEAPLVLTAVVVGDDRLAARCIRSLTAAVGGAARVEPVTVAPLPGEPSTEAFQRGLAAATGDVALLVTADVEFADGFLPPLLEALQRPGGPDAVSPTVARDGRSGPTSPLPSEAGVCLLLKVASPGATIEHVAQSVVRAQP